MSKALDDYTREELIEIIKGLKKRKKFGLVWEDKPENVVKQIENELPVLVEVPERAIDAAPGSPTNYIIEGDNFHALSILNFTHAGKFDVIFADPPYNTGARDWKYNNDYVDDTDTFRHSKWLSFMSHRLRLAKDLLSETGILCITIDDYELPRLWMLLDEIFGAENHLGTAAIRINPGGRKSKRKLAAQHEYALFFAKNTNVKVSPFYVAPEDKSHNFKQDSEGNWFEERNLRKEGQDSLATKKDGSLSHRYYPIYIDPETLRVSTKDKLAIEIWPNDTKNQKRIWRRDVNAIDEMWSKGDLTARETKFGWQVYFRTIAGLSGETPKSFWEDKKYSASEHGTGTLDKVMGESGTFQFPKSPFAVIDCIRVCSDKKDALVLDFFAGSGTTGHAVMEMNREDGGSRQFVLCTNNENKIAEEVTYPRVKNVIGGYGVVPGIPANVRYFKTDFVPKGKSDDQTRMNVVQRSVEMICVRDNTFTPVEVNRYFRIYENGTTRSAIIFDEDYIDETKAKLNELADTKPVNIYVFSLSNDTFETDFLDLEINHQLCPIPESIIEVYRRIFADPNVNSGESND